ncbi:amidohydrolase [Mesonia aquimarina]|uniref:amidohydrolase n=1 Tax=Mesonia aquimarina TaxID=1504967 RepID=UPI000EF5C680|nr:amidohydrolase [Mesonia aquimarina]
MKRALILLAPIFFLFSCEEKKEVDLLVMNAKVYTVDKDFSIQQSFVVDDGKILEIGEFGKLELRYTPKQTYDVDGKFVFPGLIDAHAHFYGLGLQQQKVNLTGTKTFEEVIKRLQSYQKEKKSTFIVGRGWDQNDWENNDFPTKDTLDILFPNTPVVLTRIDGHAMLVNSRTLQLSGISEQTKIEGGEIQQKNGELSGILIDNAMSLVGKIIPKPTKKDKISALKKAEETCLDYGLTTIDDAGLDRATIELIDSLQKTGDLNIRIYAMIANSPGNVEYYLKNGIYKTPKLNVRSFKVYADGALGSRGAALKKPYSDKENHFGAMLINPKKFKKLAQKISQSPFQMNTHAIGDSANVVVLKTYDSLLKKEEDRRWRVEHAQILDQPDFNYFSENIIPSVQPTHATSDMYWAESRLGEKRLKDAYAYKKLLKQSGKVALGTDFPVEEVNPFLTFYAAVSRKDTSGYPEGGFQKEQALNREEALRGMTIWAAYANFEEDEKGSIEQGKYADFIVLDRDIMTIPLKDIPKTKVLRTYINGEQVN